MNLGNTVSAWQRLPGLIKGGKLNLNVSHGAMAHYPQLRDCEFVLRLSGHLAQDGPLKCLSLLLRFASCILPTSWDDFLQVHLSCDHLASFLLSCKWLKIHRYTQGFQISMISSANVNTFRQAPQPVNTS